MSKELEALEEAKELTHRLITSGSWDKIEEQLNIVENALKENIELKKCIDLIGDVETNSKKLKALEIIKKKNVNMLFLKMIIDRYENCNIAKQVSQYNLSCFKQKDHLTIEQFTFLKEVLK